MPLLFLLTLLSPGLAPWSWAAEPEESPTSTEWLQIAYDHFQEGSWEAALEASQETLDRLEGAREGETWEYAQLLISLCLERLGRVEEATEPLTHLLELEESRRSDGDPILETKRYNLALALASSWQLREAEELAAQSLEGRSRTLGPLAEPTLMSRSLLAELAWKRGSYEEARQQFGSLLDDLASAELPPLRRAVLLEKGGLFWMEMSALGLALPLLEEVHQLRSEHLPPQHPHLLVSMQHLGMMHQKLGRYEQALPLLSRSTESFLQLKRPDSIAALQNLAMLKSELGQLESALQDRRQVLELSILHYGERHLHTARSHLELGEALVTRGLKEGERHLEEADAIYRARVHPLHPQRLWLEHLRAQRLQQRGELSLALATLEEPLGSMSALQRTQPMSLALQALRVQLLLKLGRDEDALATSRALLYHHESQFLSRLELVSPAERQALYQRTLAEERQRLLELHLEQRPESVEAAAQVMELLLMERGRSLELDRERLTSLYRSGDEEGLALHARRLQLSREQQQLESAPPRSAEEQLAWQEALQLLHEQLAQLEAALQQRPGYQAQPLRAVRLSEVQEALPPGALLLEFVLWRRSGEQSPRWAVYGLEQGGVLGGVDLGPVDSKEHALSLLLTGMEREGARGYSQAGPATSAALRTLSSELLEPLAPWLEERDQLLISLQGHLSLLPFEALPSPEGGLLGERHLISYLSSGRELLSPSAAPAPAGPALIVAGVDFGPADPTAESLLRSDEFLPLEGSLREGEFLHDLLPESQLLQGAAPTKERLLAARSPRILHLATHGVTVELAAPAGSQQRRQTSSYLTLAGANLKGEEALLSDMEIAGMDLQGTQLVVLSACETGLSTTRGVLGPQGLRGSLVLAGAETQVLSLWRVSDEATRLLMELFYTRLMEGAGRAEALRDAKATLREDPRFGHPFYWAAFVLSGDWTPLESGKSDLPWWRRNR